MRELYITNSATTGKADIDEKTAIGITFQAVDFAEPGKRQAAFSNSFSIPYTAHNARLFSFAHSPQSAEGFVYFPIRLNYWLDGEQVIKDAKVRIDKIDGERIFIRSFAKADVWDELATLTWGEFTTKFITWLQSERGYPTDTAPFTGTFQQFLTPYKDATEEIVLPFYYGNLYLYEPGGEGTGYLEKANEIWLKYNETNNGGHFCVKVKAVFEWIEEEYGVSFLTGGGEVPYNLWDDPIASEMIVPLRNLHVGFIDNGTSVTGYYFSDKPANGKFAPHDDTLDKGDKSVREMVNSFFNHFNVIVDELRIDNVDVFALRRFDDLVNMDPIPFGSLAAGKKVFKPSIDGYAQRNEIIFSDIFEGGDPSFGKRVLRSNNKNLDAKQELFTIDAYRNNYINSNGDLAPNLSPEDSFKTFSFFILDGNVSQPVAVKASSTTQTVTAEMNLPKAVMYSLNGEYQLLESMIIYPVVWEVEKWLTMNDIRVLQFFRQYYVKELNGSFWINKISGFNPDKSNAPTKLELIKVSDKTPLPVDNYEQAFYVDGLGNPFVDGNGNPFV
jgi:hypothetical protein